MAMATAMAMLRASRLCALLLALAAAGSACGQGVGFRELRIPNGAEPPLVGGVWYPLRAGADEIAPGRHALVLISHGGGGSYDGHADTAIALARAGIVAAAVSHAGDMVGDQRHVLELWRRPAQLGRLADYLLDASPWRAAIDPARVGAYGFSNGGFTVLVAAGGVPELSRVGPYCAEHPQHDLCTALAQAGVAAPAGDDVPPGAWTRDPRIRAIALAAPAFGFAFDRAGLSGVDAAVQLWRAADDRHQPDPYYEAAIRAALPVPPDDRVVERAGHYDFLPPCSAALARAAPVICTSAPGFERAAFHARLNAELVRFFEAALGPPAGRR